MSRLAALFPVACCNVVPLPIWPWLLPSLPIMSAAEPIRLHMHTYGYAHIFRYLCYFHMTSWGLYWRHETQFLCATY